MTQSVVVIDPSLRSEELISSLVSVSNPDLSKGRGYHIHGHECVCGHPDWDAPSSPVSDEYLHVKLCSTHLAQCLT